MDQSFFFFFFFSYLSLLFFLPSHLSFLSVDKRCVSVVSLEPSLTMRVERKSVGYDSSGRMEQGQV